MPTACNYIKIEKPYTRETVEVLGLQFFVFFFFPFPLLPKFGFILHGEINSFIFKNRLCFWTVKSLGAGGAGSPWQGVRSAPWSTWCHCCHLLAAVEKTLHQCWRRKCALSREGNFKSGVCSSPRLFGPIDPARHHQSLEESSLPSDKIMNVISSLI